MFRPLLGHDQVSVSVNVLDPYYGLPILLYNITLVTRHLGLCTT
jgi:hypothetical protein